MTSATTPLGRERGVIFSAESVRAILAGHKTQTRRLVKKRGDTDRPCRFRVGDNLWVRETWAVGACADGLKVSDLAPRVWLAENGGVWFAADDASPKTPISTRGGWRPSLFMPRWASRITLVVDAIREERLLELSETDARAEGVRPTEAGTYVVDDDNGGRAEFATARDAYFFAWDGLNRKTPHDLNPFVWAITFRRVKP